MENPIKMDDLGCSPYFRKQPYPINQRLKTCASDSVRVSESGGHDGSDLRSRWISIFKTYDRRLGGTFYMEGCLTFGRKLGHVELIYKYSVCICI